MKRRMTGIILLAIILTGCSGGGGYTPGTYEAEASGFGGALTVEVTFSDKEITDVTVKENQETKDIAEKALTEIPQKIVEAQSTEVDSVSGATMTSEAIETAVNDCIAQAKKG